MLLRRFAPVMVSLMCLLMACSGGGSVEAEDVVVTFGFFLDAVLERTELIAAAKEAGWIYSTSTPGRPQKN